MRIAHGSRSVVVTVAAAAAAVALALPSVALAATSPHQVQARVLAAPRLPLGARVVGVTPSSEHVQVSMVLQPRSASALATFARDVSEVHASTFRHYLARGAFASRFGPTSAAIASVESFARSHGLKVGALSSNHLVLSVTGTAGAFASAFSTRFAQVRLPSGLVGRSTVTPVRLPASVSSSIFTVIGLDSLLRASSSAMRPNHLRRPGSKGLGRDFPTVRPHGAPGAPSACSDASGATELGFGGITDDQVANAYGADGLYTAGDLGAGQTVAIFELEPFLRSDIAAFDECYFGADHTSNITTMNVDHGPGAGPGSGESALDIEDVSALAPSAKIDVYQGPNNSYGSLDAYNAIVADDTAKVVTSSWGFCETDQLNLSPGATAAENLIFEQAAAQGQTVFNATGDSGDDACAYQSAFPTNPVLTVGDPASQPYVVGVGGTTAVSVSQPPAEQVWNDGAFGGASTGGISSVWEQPPWMGAKANALSSASPCHAPAGEVCRTTPDVAAFADEYTGITIVYDGQWGTIGGTSSSSPIWAAMLALINASSTCTGSSSTAHGVGFAAPLLYFVASNPTDYASGFNDVTLGNNDVFGLEHGQYPARVGYDLATGLGSPQLTPAPDVLGPGLATSLCDAAQGATTARVTSISPTSGTALGGTHFTITGTGFFHASASDVSAVDLGTSPAATFNVVSNTEITGTTSTASTPSTVSKLNAVANRSGGVLVSVTTTDGDVAIGPNYHYVVETGGKSVPTVVQVGPTGGPSGGGNTVSIYGTGFTGATKVTFGGEPAKSFKVLSDVQIAAVAPKLTSATCFHEAHSTLGLCQTQIQVTGPGGKSPTVAAKKPYTGFFDTNELGEITVSKKCGCEAYPSITEYDYVKVALITKLVGQNGKSIVGDPNGQSFVELDGVGINVLTLDWVDFGPASQASSIDFELFSLNPTGTQLQLGSLADPSPGPTGNSVQVSMYTLAGSSNSKPFTYASVPVVTSLSTGVLPSAGGTTLTITGGGLSKVDEIAFSPFNLSDPPVTISANFTVHSATEITLPSPSMVPTAYEVFVCDEYSCGSGDPSTPVTSTVDVIFPGATAVTSAAADPGGAQPVTGPTAGGTTFEVQGTNFGSLSDLQVFVVNELGEEVLATGVTAGPAATDPGATESIVATSPASLGGDAEACAIVLVGDDGTSAETATALFDYS